ncbi:hypothetical protein L7F22_037199 [Adiantum nelumboides]|nr:hypothetical protein [Adiantum nelumboides]
MGPDASKFAMLPPTSFSIIAHIDHGKSTLADRLLELTGTIPMEGESGVNRQVLDSLKVERERGITVKSQAVSMIYADQRSQGREYLLNLIDTPGHVDFAYEVSRSLSACQMALLVVDATQGIQSQTLSVFRIAVARGLRIIPIINKIDLPNANTDAVLAQLESRLGLDCMPGGQDEAILVSAKTGMGVEAVLQRIVDVGFDTSDAASSAPSAAALAPRTKTTAKRGEGEKLRALVFDSWYDSYRGVIALVSVHDGVLKTGDKLAFSHSKKKYEVLDAGINSPTGISTGLLCQGQVGWVVCNMKSLTEASIGDTLHHANTHVEPLAGFKPSVPMVYCAAFPVESSDFPKLEAAIQRLALNDRSVTYARESSNALGQGIKLGLLGALHLEIFRARLEDEYEQTILVTAPSVAYRLVHQDGSSRIISNPLDFPDHVASRVEQREEERTW